APGFTLPKIYIGAAGFVASLALGVLVFMLMRMRRRPVVSGMAHMVGATAVALEDFAGDGHVRAEGERWQAHSEAPVKKGDAVIIERVDGLTLLTRPADNISSDNDKE